MSKVSVPLPVTDTHRAVAKTAALYLRNRYYEKNPILNEGEVSLISRPGRKKYITVGDGPIRAIYESPGAFDTLFVVSGNGFYTVDPTDDSVTLIGTLSDDITPTPVMTATAAIGAGTPAHLYLSDGFILWCYTENGYATGVLTATAAADGDVVTLNGVYYRLSSGSLDASSPAGTAGNPWRVLIGGTIAETIDNLAHAINETGEAGATYSTALTRNIYGHANEWSGGTLYVRSEDHGLTGNGYTTTETGANMSWSGATLTGGGSPSLLQVETPDDVGVISVAHLNGYVIVVPSEGVDINGRFYWINPGEMIIDGLSFATAERSPDPILQCIVFSDQIWFCGKTTTEVWVATGDADAPFTRFNGILFDRGVWDGTAVQVKDSLILVDTDGSVHQIKGGLKRISRPDIEERIRRAIQVAAA